MRNLNQYPFELFPLEPDDGGGFMISFPDFSNCISDGETPIAAVRNGFDALRATIATLEECGHPVPKPGSKGE